MSKTMKSKIFFSMLVWMMSISVVLTFTSCGDDNETNNNQSHGKAPSTVEAVDMGLSVKWASHNVGASLPEGQGELYAWGETEPRVEDLSSWAEYKWADGDAEEYVYERVYDMGTKKRWIVPFSKYYSGELSGESPDYKMFLAPEDDVAHVKWGGSWRMPTYKEALELIDRCTWSKKTINGVPGWIIVGPSGNSIFMPGHEDSDGSVPDTNNSYWLNERGYDPSYYEAEYDPESVKKSICDQYAYRIKCGFDDGYTGKYARAAIAMIRPVCEK